MSTLFLFLIPLATAFAPFGGMVQQTPTLNEKDDANQWIYQPLCILQASSSCPTGFTFQELRLSVQPDVNPKDRNVAGQDLMHMGEAGKSSLVYEQYDRLYTLTLAICCKQ